MPLFQPADPGYTADEFIAAGLGDRLKIVCRSWADQGYGSPAGVYAFYVLKVGAFVAGWVAWMSTVPGVDGWSDIGEWWLTPTAFQKAVIWAVAFEGVGLASGSGPLTGRYVPPLGGVLYFLRPGTMKLPLFPGLPIVGSSTRGIPDIVVHVVHLGLLVRALAADAVGAGEVVPVVVSLLLLGVFDRAAFLAARPDHYLVVLIAFAFVDWLPATKLVWVGVWWWAATSKLNRHFPSVIAVMVSNAPLLGWGPIRRLMYRAHPADLRPSRVARGLAHGGTVLEYAFPLTMVLASGGVATTVGLTAMILFHTFITTSIPMGVPIEWNVIMVYGGIFLFGTNADVRAWDVRSPLLVAALAVFLVVVPLVGNISPRHVSFLMSMRYYAGNWPFSIWLFRGGAIDRLDECLVKPSKNLERQLSVLYDAETIGRVLPKIVAFRAMHLHGRVLTDLVPRAVDDVRDHTWLDGELVAGMVVGWNFGDGHLHDERLLASVQERCGFAPGDVRVVMVESQPMGNPDLAWRIVDAADGVIERGSTRVSDLDDRQPWDFPV